MSKGSPPAPFLTLSFPDIWGQIILLWGGGREEVLSVHRRAFSSIPGLNPLNASNTPPLHLRQPKLSPDAAQGPLGGKVTALGPLGTRGLRKCSGRGNRSGETEATDTPGQVFTRHFSLISLDTGIPCGGYPRLQFRGERLT